MKYLYGKEIVGYVKERQAKQVRALKQSHGINPKLVILYDNDDPVIATYMRMKKRYGEDIGVEVEIKKSEDLMADIEAANSDDSVNAMIVQLPIKPENVEEILNTVATHKDADGLNKNSTLQPATPTAILWLLNGFNIDLKAKKVHIVGRGRLVGAPLLQMLKDQGIEPQLHTSKTGPLNFDDAGVVISATGRPRLIKEELLPEGCVVVDAGTASDKGETVGDLDDSVYERDDLTLTPKKGGVGPLTVCALFENVIIACNDQAASA